MSIEYTIDIQLTELGYPDILQTSFRESPYRPTSPDDSFSPSHAPTSLSTTQVQRLLGRTGQQPVAGKEAGAAKQTTAAPTAPLTDNCTTQNPARGPQDEGAVKDVAALESTVTDPPAGPEAADLPQLIPEQRDNSREDADAGNTARKESTDKRDAEDVSDDSEVSDFYDEEEEDEDEEEEEEDEEEEDEERLNDESSHSGGYCCCVCDQKLPSKFKLQDHMNLHTGARPYSCAECAKRFCQIYSYRAHLRTHAETKVELFRCRVCLQYFDTQKKLKIHLSRTHFEKEFYECDRCKRVFTSLKACEYHVRFPKCMVDVLCEVCGRSFSTPKSLARHRKLACHRTFKCTDCPKSFSMKNALLKHSFSHLGLLPYTCVRCHCHYRLAKLYRKHKCEPERIHCVACLRAFVSQEDFQRHKKDTGCWGNQEPKGDEIRCLECGERFDTSEELKKHAGAHQRVLKCAECGKGFRSALLLMSHMGGHAGNSPCLCQSCGLGFPHQQNYDSHLKTCGQTAQPASAPKKRHASKRVNAKPASSLPTAAPAAPGKGSQTPGPATGGVSAGPGQPDGLWKLTLNGQPPPGVNLLVFFPVCTAQTDGVTPTSAVSPALPAPPAQPEEAPPPDSNEPLGVNAALGATTNGPLNLVAGIKQHPQWEAPLDLSNKPSLSTSTLSNVPPPAIKSEPGNLEISGEAPSTDTAEFSKVVVETNLGGTDTDTEGKKCKVDPMDLSSCTSNTTSSGPVVDVKKEPQSAGPAFGPWSSRSCQLTEKEIKMEVDVAEEK